MENMIFKLLDSFVNTQLKYRMKGIAITIEMESNDYHEALYDMMQHGLELREFSRHNWFEKNGYRVEYKGYDFNIVVREPIYMHRTLGGKS